MHSGDGNRTLKWMWIRYLLPMLVLAADAANPPVPNRSPLQPNAFNALPLGSVMPKGWLLEQLRLQAQGLSGHLDEFWADLGPESAWLGGSGEGWERGPYFLDGLVPLAYLTNERVLIAKVKKWMDWVLDHQQPDGAIGPVKNLDWWPNYVMLKALITLRTSLSGRSGKPERSSGPWTGYPARCGPMRMLAGCTCRFLALCSRP